MHVASLGSFGKKKSLIPNFKGACATVHWVQTIKKLGVCVKRNTNKNTNTKKACKYKYWPWQLMGDNIAIKSDLLAQANAGSA